MGKYKASRQEKTARAAEASAAQEQAAIAKEQWEMARPIYRGLSREAQKPTEEQTYFKRMIGGLERDYGNVGANIKRSLAGRYQYGSGYEGEAAKNLELSRATGRAGAWQASEEARTGMLLQLATGGTAQAQRGYAAAGAGFGDVARQRQELRIAKAGQQTSATSSGISSITSMCCWVFIKGEMMSDSVRRLRDQLFHPDSFVAKGYKKMAWWLIPLMHKYPLVMKIVRSIMLRPMKKFADTYNPIYAPICIFWAIVWDFYGRWAKLIKREVLWRAYPRHEYYDHPEERASSISSYKGMWGLLNLAIYKKLEDGFYLIKEPSIKEVQ